MQARRNRGEALGGTAAPKIFATVDLLLIDNDTEKKKIAKKIQASSNSSETTGNITFVYFM